MGVEPFLVTASVNLILAQRLARKVCQECKAQIDVPQQTLLDLGLRPDEVSGATINKGAGCHACSNTGFKGRIAIYEVMTVTETLKELILNGASAAELKMQAVKEGMKSLRRSALDKLLQGVTSPEEVLRVSVTD
jgi:type IV pilus assembly protein PilB